MSENWDDEPEEWESDPEERARLERNGFFAVALGILAQTTAMFVCCTYGITALPALVMGGVALFLGKAVLDTGVQGAPRAYGLVGMVTGGIAMAWSGLVLFLCGAYVALYALMIAVMAAGGNF